MKFISALVAAAVASAASTNIDIKLERVSNSKLKAVVANTGQDDISVFTPGTILDKSAVQKVKVDSNGRSAEFVGIKKRISTKTIHESSLQSIPAGKSVEVTFDVAEFYDLSRGGKFNINSVGDLPIKSADGLVNVPFKSNTLSVDVDGAKAADVHAAHAQKYKRTDVQSDCSGQKLQVTQTALQNCVDLSNAAGQVAQSGDASKMEEFFKASDDQTRGIVADVFSKVASECGSTTGGVSKYYCTDVGNDCGGNVLAYTSPAQSFMVYCDLYFNDLPPLTKSCHAQDQATTNIHECTHLTQIKGTDDLGYGYDNIRQLSAQDELNNADTFAVFAGSIYAGC